MRAKHSVNEGFGKEFHRKDNSMKRSRPFSEPPGSEIYWIFLRSSPSHTSVLTLIFRSLVVWFSLVCSSPGNSLVFRVFSEIVSAFLVFLLWFRGVKNPWCFGRVFLVFLPKHQKVKGIEGRLRGATDKHRNHPKTARYQNHSARARNATHRRPHWTPIFWA